LTNCTIIKLSEILNNCTSKKYLNYYKPSNEYIIVIKLFDTKLQVNKTVRTRISRCSRNFAHKTITKQSEKNYRLISWNVWAKLIQKWSLTNCKYLLFILILIRKLILMRRWRMEMLNRRREEDAFLHSMSRLGHLVVTCKVPTDQLIDLRFKSHFNLLAASLRRYV